MINKELPLSLSGIVEEYIPVPIIDDIGFILCIIDNNGAGAWVSCVKDRSYKTAFEKMFFKSCGIDFYDTIEELIDRTGADFKSVNNEFLENSTNEIFIYPVWVDRESCLKGIDWLESRLVAAKLGGINNDNV